MSMRICCAKPTRMRAGAIFITIRICINIKGQTSYHFGLFPTIDHSGTINKKLDYGIYYFAGFNLINEPQNIVKESANLFVVYAEQSLTYKINNHLSFTGSYVFEKQYPLKNNYRNENRFYLQSTYKYLLNKHSIKHRIRHDGRFIENRITGKAPFTSRIRYLGGISGPVSKKNERLYFSMYNEFFFNTYRNAANIYDENWAYAGMGYKTKTAGNFEIGPLYIFWITNKQNDFKNFIYLQLTWNTHLNLSKKKE